MCDETDHLKAADDNIESTPSTPEHAKTAPDQASKIINTKLYFAAYFLLHVFTGCLITFSGSIYVELQSDLNVSTYTISWIYSSIPFAMILSAFVSGYILDKFTESHKYLSILIIISSICLCLIPFIRNIPFMFIIFIFIGFGFAGNDTCGSVWIFRVYPDNGGQMFFIFQTILSVSSMLTPLIFQLSISQSGQYSYPLFGLAVIGVTYSILLIFLSTPKHDKLRTIKRKIKRIASTSPSAESAMQDTELDELSRKTSSHLKQKSDYKQLQWIMLSILILLVFCHSAAERAMTIFITPYCSDYVGVDDSIGRYLISCYWASNLFYRLVNVAMFRICKIEIDIVWLLVIGFVIRLIVSGVMFIIWGHIVQMLFVIYIITGFFCGGIFPGVFQWGEMIRPFTGFLSCLFLVGYYGGEAVFIAIMGVLIEAFGIVSLPYAMMVPMGVAVVIIGVNVILFKRYKQTENEAIDEAI